MAKKILAGCLAAVILIGLAWYAGFLHSDQQAKREQSELWQELRSLAGRIEAQEEQQAEARQLQEVIAAFSIDVKIVVRKKYYVVYIKEGSQIVEILGVMEAHVALMELENIRILKEMRNSVNRQVNCETANINKTVSAAVKQLGDIAYIRDTVGLDFLPEALAEIAKLRLEMPDATLKELGENLSAPVGKSGVNHRLRKISTIAESLREERGDP